MNYSARAANAWLRQAQARLEGAKIGTARLDALVLLEHVIGKDRAWVLAHPEFELTAGQVTKLEKLLKRRTLHEPLAYVRGKTEFYGREFLVTPAVLEPRPESETMIDLLKQLSSRPDFPIQPRIADVGTGSGALGITAQLELPHAKVELIELDLLALKVAKINVDKFTPTVNTVKSDLLSETTESYDILLCNLPYVPDSHTVNAAAMHEPSMAIFGGSDGLDVYRKLLKQIENLKNKPLYLLLESLPSQHKTLTQLAQLIGYCLVVVEGFILVLKIVSSKYKTVLCKACSRAGAVPHRCQSLCNVLVNKPYN